MNYKKISLLITLITGTFIGAYAQAKGPVFKGSIVYQIVVEMKKSPDAKTAQSFQANFRLTCDKDKFGIDSVSTSAPMGDKIQGAKLMIDKSGIMTVGYKDEDGFKGGYFHLKTLVQKRMDEMKKANQAPTEETFKKSVEKLDSMGLKPVFTVTNERQVISDYPCRKIMIKMGGINMDMWVTDKLSIRLKDYFTELAAVMGGTQAGDSKKMMEMANKYYNIPPEFQNATPVRIIIKINNQPNDKKNPFSSMTNALGGIMINIVNVGSRVDASAFDFSQYKLESYDKKFDKKSDNTTAPEK